MRSVSLAFAITLEQAWQAAKTADPTYMQAQIQSQIRQTDVATATSVLRPSLNITAQTSWNQDGDNQRGYGATLTQTLWDGLMFGLRLINLKLTMLLRNCGQQRIQ
ncbi:TolC family protein [Vibrio metschnikovii]